MAAPVSPNVVVKWNGKEYTISDINDTDTVHDLKCMISKQTGVLPERQKLIGLKLKGIESMSENFPYGATTFHSIMNIQLTCRSRG